MNPVLSRIVFLAGVGFLMLLFFCPGRLTKGETEYAVGTPEFRSVAMVRTTFGLIDPWYEAITRDTSVKVLEDDGKLTITEQNSQGHARVIWNSWSWLFPLSAVVWFWIRERSLLMDGRQNGRAEVPAPGA